MITRKVFHQKQSHLQSNSPTTRVSTGKTTPNDYGEHLPFRTRKVLPPKQSQLQSNSPTTRVSTGKTTPNDHAEGFPPKQSHLQSNSPTTRVSTGKTTPNDYAVSTPSDSAAKEQVDAHHPNPTPESPIIRNSPEEPDSLWLTKGRKQTLLQRRHSFLFHILHCAKFMQQHQPEITSNLVDLFLAIVWRANWIAEQRLHLRRWKVPKMVSINTLKLLLEERISRIPLLPHTVESKEYSGVVSDESKGTYRSERSSPSKERQDRD
ncbi:hypothetical protein KIN20_031161 [Parelaphostrongylus tenuis]|uniref:Uncharacterized protein n=1 Tax=Parelaphostrongylus tenuis TaxID=148309 RepID=A0AAD5WGU0_PARTN|nr:hypothetical protein KIN20_031161 [Parelaphostrongylus tenuis]